jgi:hypothetical protein
MPEKDGKRNEQAEVKTGNRLSVPGKTGTKRFFPRTRLPVKHRDVNFGSWKSASFIGRNADEIPRWRRKAG